MRKIILTLLSLLLAGLLAIPVGAVPEEPVITMQPQSPSYSQYSVATYTVKVDGENLTATWYIEYEGKTYNASQIGGAMQPWEAYAGESYGAKKVDNNTFSFVFEGIEKELNGASIWCVLEDGHYDVTSQKAQICVGSTATPPQILSIPSELTVQQGEEAEIRCVAKSSDGSQLSFLWYETHTGKMEDIRAINRGTEDCDYLFCDTSETGTRYYVCMVSSANGGSVYSSVVAVTVEKKQTTAVQDTQIQTKSLATAVVGEKYSAELKCNDSQAEFAIYYNPGKGNDFDKTGLTLSKSGTISGTPTQAGTYTFSVCAAGAGGEDYATYTLTITEASTPAGTEATIQVLAPEETIQVTVPTVEETIPETLPATEPAVEETLQVAEPAVTQTIPETLDATDETQTPPEEPNGISWWVVLLVALGAAGIGVAVAFMLIKKK